MVEQNRTAGNERCKRFLIYLRHPHQRRTTTRHRDSINLIDTRYSLSPPSSHQSILKRKQTGQQYPSVVALAPGLSRQIQVPKSLSSPKTNDNLTGCIGFVSLPEDFSGKGGRKTRDITKRRNIFRQSRHFIKSNLSNLIHQCCCCHFISDSTRLSFSLKEWLHFG